MDTSEKSTASKFCGGCSRLLAPSSFYKSRAQVDGLQTQCKECQNKRKGAWAKANAGQQRAIQRENYALNPARHMERKAAWRAANPEKAKQIGARSRIKNKASNAASSRRWILANPEKRRQMQRAWYAKNRERAAKRARDYRHSSIGRILHHRISARVREQIKDGKRGQSILKYLDFSMADLARHFERQFLPGMSFANYGKWHIEHIVPLSSFKVTGIDCPEFKSAWALTNLRPLWDADNRKKRATRTHLL